VTGWNEFGNPGCDRLRKGVKVMRILLQRTLQALVCILALLVVSPQRSLATQAPKGIYAFVIVDQDLINTASMVAKHNSISTDMALFNYFSWILSNDAVSGLLIGVQWSILNPNDPNPTTGLPPSVLESTFACPPTPSTAVNLAAAYVWNSLDAAFCAVNAAKKTLQLSVSPGFNSPQWLYQSLFPCPPGVSCFGPVSGHLSPCDSLFFSFLRPNGLNFATSKCGYTTIFVRTESEPHIHLPLPLPWNKEYQRQWKKFLTKLNNHIKSNSTFVSIGVAGPTASSGEMILPNNIGQARFGHLTVPNLPSGYVPAGGITATAAWNCLLANSYGGTSAYLNSDQAFIEAWETAIDTYGSLFSGITLIVNTGNGLPIFHDPAPYPNNVPPGCSLTKISLPAASFVKPTWPFTPDCHGSANMDCAAETAILSYFLTPAVGGSNAKAIAEDGLSASDGLSPTFRSLSAASVKWLSSPKALTYLPPKTVVLGGLQFASPFSTDIEKGCPYPYGPCQGCQTGTLCNSTGYVSASTCPASSAMCPLQGWCSANPSVPSVGPECSQPASGETCPKGNTCAVQAWCSTGSSCISITPEDALYNVLQNFFAGTIGAPTTANNNGTPVSGAPINYLQIYASDILYALGLAESYLYPSPTTGGCTLEHLMSVAPPTLPKKCTVAAPLPTSKINGMTAQEMLNQASTQVLKIAVTPP
jgi:hypothetical protein